MTNVVLLNNVDHHDLRLLNGQEAAAAVDQVPVFPTEFEAVQREYPILLRRDPDGDFHAVALLGLAEGDNLFVEDGRWTARYQPALLARGPFSIGLHEREAGEREPMIHVDLASPMLSREAGEPLFLPHGGHAPGLEQIAEVLRTIHAGHQMQGALFAAWEAAGLIEPVRLEIMLDDTLRYDLVDYHAVSRDVLDRLSGDALERLHRQGYLAAAVHAVSSLGNVERLIALHNRRRQGG